jgi:hypothetical protein
MVRVRTRLADLKLPKPFQPEVFFHDFAFPLGQHIGHGPLPLYLCPREQVFHPPVFFVFFFVPGFFSIVYIFSAPVGRYYAA